uniref:ABC transmembrane type-1 domain-containing protein n=1 Tax=Panagrolaimus sp. JU765 TaxID=591449 RepID=A0AC34R6X4_9BILA
MASVKKSNKPGFKEFFSIINYLAVNDYVFLAVGSILAAFTGAGLPHLVCVVGWLLNAFVMLEPTSDAFRDRITPLLLYFVSAASVLAVIAFLQYVCFRLVALKVCRRVRRKYFRQMIIQPLNFFKQAANEKANCEFEGHVAKLAGAITDSLPAIITSISQVTVALLISFHFGWKLALPITGLGAFVVVWFLTFNALLMYDNKNEQKLARKTAEALKYSSTFREHCNKLFNLGIRKAAYSGILVGSIQLFIYIGMGLGALYGNWLIDHKLMQYPGYIFVIACSIIPAAVKLGQLHLNISGLWAARFALSEARRVQDRYPEDENPTTLPAAPTRISIGEDPTLAPPPEYWSSPEMKRKQFLTTFFQNEIATTPESPRPKNCSAFIHLRKSALQRKLYGLGFLFCLVFAAAPPTFTKLNGDLYEFYQIGRVEPFFADGVSISWKYLAGGVITCLAGIFCTIIYARNGESIAREVRCAVYTDFTNRHGATIPESVRRSMLPLVNRAANQCKAAFDARLSTFTVGVFSLAFGVAFVFEKNLPSAFLCSICFGLQAVAQYFVFRIADVHFKRAMNEKNERARIGLQTFEAMSETQVGENLSDIAVQHDQYLTFAYHRHSSVVATQALRFAFIVAVPQNERARIGLQTFEAMSETQVGENLSDIAVQHDQYLTFAYHRHSSVVATQALRFAFIVAVPQVTQAISYVIGCFLVVEGLVRAVVLYKVVQTLYMSAFSIATVAQFNMDIQQARIGALDLDEIIGESDTQSRNSGRSRDDIVLP